MIFFEFHITTKNYISYLILLFLKILYAKDVDQRSATFEKSIEMGKEYQKRTKAIVLRTLVMKYNITVKVTFLFKVKYLYLF